MPKKKSSRTNDPDVKISDSNNDKPETEHGIQKNSSDKVTTDESPGSNNNDEEDFDKSTKSQTDLEGDLQTVDPEVSDWLDMKDVYEEEERKGVFTIFSTDRDSTPNNYYSYLSHKLRTQHQDLEYDFRTMLRGRLSSDNKIDSLHNELALRLVEMFRKAAILLNNNIRDHLSASHLFNSIERHIIRFAVGFDAIERMRRHLTDIANNELQKEKNRQNEELIKNVKEIKEELEKIESNHRIGENIDIPKDIYSRFNSILFSTHQLILEKQINNGLRLKMYQIVRNWTFFFLIFFLAVTPLVIFNPSIAPIVPEPVASASSSENTGSIVGGDVESGDGSDVGSSSGIKLLPIFDNLKQDFWRNYVLAISIIVIGMIGGIVSGLTNLKSSQPTLLNYQIAWLEFQLRPLIGGTFALTLIMILSWDILPGINVDEVGTYLLVAFLAGFSERYFTTFLESKGDINLDHGKQADNEVGGGNVA